jgi:hypothetical protein
MAEQSGDAHHAKAMDEVLAALLSIGANGRPLAHEAVLELGVCTVQCAADLLRQLCDFSVHLHLLLLAPPSDRGGVILDFAYPGTSMRLLLTHAPSGHLRVVLQGINGMAVVLELRRVIDWSEPRYVCIQQHISDDLQTTLRLLVEGEVYAEVTVDYPVFVVGEMTKFERFLNRSQEAPDSGTHFALIRKMVLSGPLRPEVFSLIGQEFERNRAESEAVILYQKHGWGRAAPGSTSFAHQGPVHQWSWRLLLEGEFPPPLQP